MIDTRLAFLLLLLTLLSPVSHSHAYSGSPNSVASTLYEALELVTNELPKNIFRSLLEATESTISEINDYQNYRSSFFEDSPDEDFKEGPRETSEGENIGGEVDGEKIDGDNSNAEKEGNSKGSRSEENLNVRIITDVVFVGFPSTAVDVLREKWLDPLSREDAFASLLISSSQPSGFSQRTHSEMLEFLRSESGNLLSISHQFHAVQVSQHVEAAIRNRLRKLIRPTDFASTNLLGAVADCYLNSWEVEDFLSELASAVSSSHTKVVLGLEGGAEIPVSRQSERPDATLFVLNVEGIGIPTEREGLEGVDGTTNYSYSYISGFTEGDLALLAKDPELLKLAKDVKKTVASKSRISLEANKERGSYDGSLYTPLMSSIPLNVGSGAVSEDDLELLDWRDKDLEEELFRSPGSWKDAVKATRSWTQTQELKETSFQSDLLSRARAILTARDGTVFSKYRHSLSESILRSVQASIVDASLGSVVLPPPPCSSSIWAAGASRTLWVDLHAISAQPVSGQAGVPSNIVTEPSGLSIGDEEWRRMGANAGDLDSKAIRETLRSARISLHNQLLKVVSLQAQLGCPSHAGRDMYMEDYNNFRKKYETDLSSPDDVAVGDGIEGASTEKSDPAGVNEEAGLQPDENELNLDNLNDYTSFSGIGALREYAYYIHDEMQWGGHPISCGPLAMQQMLYHATETNSIVLDKVLLKRKKQLRRLAADKKKKKKKSNAYSVTTSGNGSSRDVARYDIFDFYDLEEEHGVALRELTMLHIRLITSAIEVSNPLLSSDQSPYLSGHALPSQEAIRTLSELASKTLRIARELLTPHMSMHASTAELSSIPAYPTITITVSNVHSLPNRDHLDRADRASLLMEYERKRRNTLVAERMLTLSANNVHAMNEATGSSSISASRDRIQLWNTFLTTLLPSSAASSSSSSESLLDMIHADRDNLLDRSDATNTYEGHVPVPGFHEQSGRGHHQHHRYSQYRHTPVPFALEQALEHNESHSLEGLQTVLDSYHRFDSQFKSLLSVMMPSPSLVIPSSIQVVLYVVSLQDTYEPLEKPSSTGENKADDYKNSDAAPLPKGLDIWRLMEEVTRLTLPNQEVLISVERLHIDGFQSSQSNARHQTAANGGGGGGKGVDDRKRKSKLETFYPHLAKGSGSGSGGGKSGSSGLDREEREESGLGLGMASCLRASDRPAGVHFGQLVSRDVRYLSSDCVWQFLQRVDGSENDRDGDRSGPDAEFDVERGISGSYKKGNEKGSDEGEKRDEVGINTNKKAAKKTSIFGSKQIQNQKRSSRRIVPDAGKSAAGEVDELSIERDSVASIEKRVRQKLTGKLYLPVFIISLDTPSPTLLDEVYQAVPVGAGRAVLAVQNRQSSIESDVTCAGQKVRFDGRNPYGPLLRAIAEVLSGLPNPDTVRQAGKSDRNKGASDASTAFGDRGACGESPVFSSQRLTLPFYSYFDLDSLHRNRILRLVGVSRMLLELADEGKRKKDVSDDGAAYSDGRAMSYPVRKAAEILIKSAILSLQAHEWARGSALANHALVKSITSLLAELSPSPFHSKQEKGGTKKTNYSSVGRRKDDKGESKWQRYGNQKKNREGAEVDEVGSSGGRKGFIGITLEWFFSLLPLVAVPAVAVSASFLISRFLVRSILKKKKEKY